MLVAIALEGVLRAPIGSGPIPEGLELYRSLVTTQRVAVVLDDLDQPGAALWLKKEGLADYVMLHPMRPVDEDRVAQLRRLRALGGVSMVIDPDPQAVAGAMKMGITGLLFAQPKVARPEFRPDFEREPRPWDSMVAEVEFQRTVEA